MSKLLVELEGCPFGRFLVQNKANYFNDFGYKIITKPLAFVATQFRSLVFKKNVTDLKDNSYVMSAPASLLPEFTKDLILVS